MALDEYQRKRRFEATPEPPPKVESRSGRRFVVQKHRASHLHYDFRLEMEGVLKSWAVPKGPSLDPADKRLAMMVEDHPASYIHFEGIIPPGNYGAGAVMVWDTGTWEAQGNASEMLARGDLKFVLKGEKLKGSFVLARMRSRRPGSKGNEWLLIKHRDEYVVPGYNIDDYDYSVLTRSTLDEIAGDQSAAEWQSSRPATTAAKNEWLAEAIAKHDHAVASAATKKSAKKAVRNAAKKAASPTATKSTAKRSAATKSTAARQAKSQIDNRKSEITSAPSAVKSVSSREKELESLKAAQRAKMPSVVRPMLATLVDGPFNGPDWLYEIKWDGYRAIAFVEEGKVRLVSRNQNDLTPQCPELASLADYVRARNAVLDGEICALDNQGRASFSLMQQRTGSLGHGFRRGQGDRSIPIVYYAFDLLYLDGFDLRRVDLEQRKRLLGEILATTDLVRFSEDFPDGMALYQAARERGLEGIVAKRRRGCYLEKRSREWLKLKITQRQECVIGGYTDPRGSRENFGSIVLGLYDDRGRLIHVGQAGSGFTEATHADMWRRLQRLETDKNPFHGKVEANRRTHWVRPELVAEIKFIEWTHEGESGQVKMRAPVFEGLRPDKSPRECVLELPREARKEAAKAEPGEAA
ncbi:MAG: non-homologous end-joining DNA ligase [Terriglobales bacterium]